MSSYDVPMLCWTKIVSNIVLTRFLPQHGMTALIWASGRGHTAVVNHLLDAGANPDAADKVRETCQLSVTYYA